MKINSICVFCGASERVDKEYKELATQCGQIIGQKKLHLIYGGGGSGLMGGVSKAVHENGGRVTGIYPKLLEIFEPLSHDLDNTILVESMSKRKDLMIERSDCFIILPGGFGTLDELFEIITLKILKQHDKPILFCNYNGYWSTLLKFCDEVIAKNFAKPNANSTYEVVDTLEQIFQKLGL